MLEGVVLRDYVIAYKDNVGIDSKYLKKSKTSIINYHFFIKCFDVKDKLKASSDKIVNRE